MELAFLVVIQDTQVKSVILCAREIARTRAVRTVTWIHVITEPRIAQRDVLKVGGEICVITSVGRIVLRIHAISLQGCVLESVRGDIMETTVIKAAVSTVLMDFVINLQVSPHDISVLTVHIFFIF